uniref:Translation initiation factor 1 n=1 Tax=Colocasia esculenta TaxID=4460 RepID=A0A346QLE3_COLES|nr:translation initiation factor 1 [Colocasia esculenta]AXR94012.1 translation initiation factor 1 [Colocasia esculenta]AXR94096.1 translation initiation factor 1 [Colocasia esculenta]AXR94855.1 translation initiation factor 1 [Colocasia esculenta]
MFRVPLDNENLIPGYVSGRIDAVLSGQEIESKSK